MLENEDAHAVFPLQRMQGQLVQARYAFNFMNMTIHVEYVHIHYQSLNCQFFTATRLDAIITMMQNEKF